MPYLPSQTCFVKARHSASKRCLSIVRLVTVASVDASVLACSRLLLGVEARERDEGFGSVESEG